MLEEKLLAGMKPPEALIKAFLECDGKLKKDKSIDAVRRSGSCLSVKGGWRFCDVPWLLCSTNPQDRLYW